MDPAQSGLRRRRGELVGHSPAGIAAHGAASIEASRLDRDLKSKSRKPVDLIYGVAGDTRPLLERDVSTAFSLPIDHISLYALTIEEATAFEKTPEKAHEELDLTRWLFKEIADRGFEQYEISNFGRTRSRHNLGYWEHKPYIGLGSGAVGFLRNRRFYPPNDIQTYIADPLAAHVEERVVLAGAGSLRLVLSRRARANGIGQICPQSLPG